MHATAPPCAYKGIDDVGCIAVRVSVLSVIHRQLSGSTLALALQAEVPTSHCTLPELTAACTHTVDNNCQGQGICVATLLASACARPPMAKHSHARANTQLPSQPTHTVMEQTGAFCYQLRVFLAQVRIAFARQAPRCTYRKSTT